MEDVEKNKLTASILKQVPLKSAGIKPSKPSKNEMDCCVPSMNSVRYPCLYLDIQQAPDLTGYETGDEVVLLVKATIVSHSKNSSMNMYSSESKKNNESFELQVKEIGCLHGSQPKKSK